MNKSDFDLEKYFSIIEWMKEQHGSQLRTFGFAPYWTHPIRVACLVMKYKQSHKMDALVVAALLHDVVEDTKVTLRYSEKGEAPSIETLCKAYQIEDADLVFNLIEELTSDKGAIRKIGKIAYLSDKMVKMSKWGLVIKLCDRLDNVSDLLFAPHSFVKKYGEETYQILRDLRIKRDERDKNLSDTHYAIMNQIEKVLWQYNTIINETEEGE